MNIDNSIISIAASGGTGILIGDSMTLTSANGKKVADFGKGKVSVSIGIDIT
jgi:hypothetical protein